MTYVFMLCMYVFVILYANQITNSLFTRFDSIRLLTQNGSKCDPYHKGSHSSKIVAVVVVDYAADDAVSQSR